MDWWLLAGMLFACLITSAGVAYVFIRWHVALGLVLAVLTVSTATALLVTGGHTSLIFMWGMALVAAVLVRRQQGAANDPFAREALGVFGIVAFGWFALVAWAYTPLGGVLYGKSLQDVFSYGTIGEYMLAQGQERLVTNPDMPTPYHYVDIWLAVMLRMASGINMTWLFSLVVVPWLTATAASVIWTLVRGLGLGKWQAGVIVTVGLMGVILPVELLAWLRPALLFADTATFYIVAPTHFKLLPAMLLTLTAASLVRWSVPGALLVLGSVGFAYGTLAPVAVSAALLITGHLQWQRRAQWWYWLLAIGPGVLWAVWYRAFLLGTMGGHEVPFALRTAFNIGARTGLHLLAMFGLVVLVFWPLVRQYWQTAIGWVLVAVAGIPLWALAYRTLDSVQAFSNPFTVALQVGLVGLGIAAGRRGGRIWMRFAWGLGLVALVHLGWSAWQARREQQSYDPAFRAAMAASMGNAPARVAVYAPVAADRTLWEKHQFFVYTLPLVWRSEPTWLVSVTGSAIAPSVTDVVQAARERKLIEALPFQRYWQASGLPEAEARRAFLQAHGIRFLLVEGRAEPPADLPVRLLAENPAGGDRFFAVVY